ncbi:hypothetical protein [Bordetella trematum]|uniref:hypothetical protein n=1 Tax=Bordetella trematum TaxID=123899 RepID=UPI00398A0047
MSTLASMHWSGCVAALTAMRCRASPLQVIRFLRGGTLQAGCPIREAGLQPARRHENDTLLQKRMAAGAQTGFLPSGVRAARELLGHERQQTGVVQCEQRNRRRGHELATRQHEHRIAHCLAGRARAAQK